MSARSQIYRNPVSVRFGIGILSELPELLRNRPAVIVTFPEAEETGLLQRIQEIIGKDIRGIVSDVEPNPSVSWVESHHAEFWKRYQDCVVVAVGGGSAIDTAKLLLTMPPSGNFNDTLIELRSGRKPAVARCLPLIAVPTTAGTGSEVTPWATLWDRDASPPQKLSLHLDALWAESALVDPELTLTLPSSITRSSALDALSHALESIWNVNANPVSDALAIRAAHGIIAHLPGVLKDPKNIQHRTEIARASLLAGLAFSNTKTALAHSISYIMTLRYGVTHGIASSFPLPLVWSLAKGISTERDAVLAKVFGPNETDGPKALEVFLKSVGVECSFDAYGTKNGEEDEILKLAFGGERGQNFIRHHIN
jgi:phosphonate metabolism-associated iron-containing alcohol dehydrogenase